MADPSSRQRLEYQARINRVIDYIEQRLDQNLSLAELADVAHFSRYHFHRVFKAMTGETLARYIARLRLQKAASQLIHNPRKSMIEIALDCGFSGSAPFSRAFKDAFGVSPSAWRDQDGNPDQPQSNTGQPDGKHGQDRPAIVFYIEPQTNQPEWRFNMKDNRPVNVTVKELPQLNVAYVRHVGPYKGDGALFANLFGRLMAWAGPRNLIRFPETQMLCVYHDDPNLTEEDKLRTSVCMTVPEGTAGEGEVGTMTVPGGRFAVARFEIKEDEYEDAWNAVMRDWLPESGYQPDDRLCYELFHNDPNQHPEKLHIFDICLPVRPL
jgi:AraC family transcriptional regulator